MVVVLEVVAVLLKAAGVGWDQDVLVLQGDVAGRVLGAAGGQPWHGRGPRFQCVIGGVSSCVICHGEGKQTGLSCSNPKVRVGRPHWEAPQAVQQAGGP